MSTLTHSTNYRGFKIEEDNGNYHSPKYIYYPASEGIQHDYDYDDERYRYCGNCGWADSIDEAKDAIFEKIMVGTPSHVVVMNLKKYPFTWIEDAIKFAVMWKGEFLTPIINP